MFGQSRGGLFNDRCVLVINWQSRKVPVDRSAWLKMRRCNCGWFYLIRSKSLNQVLPDGMFAWEFYISECDLIYE